MLDVAPCEGHQQIFDSVHWGDHQGARRFCVDQDGTPRCPFYAACLRMTDAERAGDLGAHCVEGTRAGSLYIDGKRVTEPRTAGRNGGRRQTTLPGIDANAREAHAAYKRGDDSEWAKAGHRAYERQRWAAKKGGTA